MKRLASASGGFTLVEVVVSLAILSLIMVATISALRTFGQTQTSLDKVTQRIDEVRSVSSFLRDTFESSVVGKSSGGGLSMGGGASAGSYLKGGTTAMDWKAFVQFGEGYGGAFLVRVERDQHQLKLKWQDIPAKLDNVSWEGTPERVLVEDLDELQIDYRKEIASAWQEEWLQQNSPAFVRMTIKAHGRFWPELIFTVQR
ncbi:MAG: prepilin-type N-terminal cleavage/methylation domain-containing protein [Halioglobus sp.]